MPRGEQDLLSLAAVRPDPELLRLLPAAEHRRKDLARLPVQLAEEKMMATSRAHEPHYLLWSNFLQKVLTSV